MNEHSRIVIAEYCRTHGRTKKSIFLNELLEMSYDVCGVPEDWQAIKLEQYINREKDSRLLTALEELDDYLFG